MAELILSMRTLFHGVSWKGSYNYVSMCIRLCTVYAHGTVHTYVSPFITIIIVIRHESGLNRPVSVSSYSPFQGLPSRLLQSVYNSALFLAPCCCSLFLHAVANLICIFSVSRQLVLLSALPKFLSSFCSHKGRNRLFC